MFTSRARALLLSLIAIRPLGWRNRPCSTQHINFYFLFFSSLAAAIAKKPRTLMMVSHGLILAQRCCFFSFYENFERLTAKIIFAQLPSTRVREPRTYSYIPLILYTKFQQILQDFSNNIIIAMGIISTLHLVAIGPKRIVNLFFFFKKRRLLKIHPLINVKRTREYFKSHLSNRCTTVATWSWETESGGHYL